MQQTGRPHGDAARAGTRAAYNPLPIHNMKTNTPYFIASFLAFLFCATAVAQEDRQAAYEQSIDFVKCKCIEVIYGISLACENDPAIARVEQYAARHPRTGTLMGELERLKQKQAASLPTDSITQLLATDIFHADNRSTYPQSYNFSVNRGRNTDGTLATLQTAITAFVQQRVPALASAADLAMPTDTLVEAALPPTPILDEQAIADHESAAGDRQHAHSFFSFHLNIAHILLAGLAILVAWLLVNRLRREYEEQINDLKFRLEGKAETGDLEKVESELSHFNERLAVARKKRLAEQQAKAQAKPAQAATPGASRPLRVEKVLYLPAPNADGSFRVADESAQFRPAVSVYKFKIDPDNPDLATFSFHSDNIGLQHAIGHPATYIRPVCVETNPAHPGAKYVATAVPGQATRKGDAWVVAESQKAQIRYE